MLKRIDSIALFLWRILDPLMDRVMNLVDSANSRATLFKKLTLATPVHFVIHKFLKLVEYLVVVLAMILCMYLELRGIDIERCFRGVVVPDDTYSGEIRRRPSPPNHNWLKEGF